jgi:hypothetical protein
MDHEIPEGRRGQDGAMATSLLTAVDAALAVGDVTAAVRAWNEAYGVAIGSRRWESFAEAGDAYLRIARASGSPAAGISRARDLYLSALFRASGAGSLEGVLRVALAFVELGDDEVVTHSLRIARRLAEANGASEHRERFDALRTHQPNPAPLS